CPMAASALGLGAGQSAAQLTRTLERLLEDAQLTGELRLNGRKLRELPKCTAKYDLRDTVHADLSKNRLYELPPEVCQLSLLERLDCHNNLLRTVPSSVISMQSLTYLDLSRNQLSTVPAALCQLPIQVLILSNNRLVSLPQEIGLMKCLMDLDASCNELCLLPPGIGELSGLRCLRVRRNRLVELPVELCGLRLWRLDLGANRLARLPPALRLMTSLQELLLDCNPIVSPPAFLCTRGKVHVFKFLEMEAIKEDRKRGALLDSDGELRHLNGQLPEAKRSTLDSGYSTSDGDRRCNRTAGAGRCSEGLGALSVAPYNQLQVATSTAGERRGPRGCPQGIPPHPDVQGVQGGPSATAVGRWSGAKKGLGGERQRQPAFLHLLQPPRARQQPRHPCDEGPAPVPRPTNASLLVRIGRTLRRVLPLCAGGGVPGETRGHRAPAAARGSPGPAAAGAGPAGLEAAPKRPDQGDVLTLQSAPKVERGAVREAPSPGRPNGLTPPAERGKGSPRTPPRRALAVGPDPHFTIRRGLEKAREEQELLDQLRWPLKVSLPPELGPSLMDGVVLCHLANQVRPRSVASIHVPSPAVPKLTMAKCRRNVENFLGACRQLGVPEEATCSSQDVLEEKGLVRVAVTVQELFKLAGGARH
ncbi:calponin homology (CH) domain-containing, chdc/lrch, partial [Ixodes scapularis]